MSHLGTTDVRDVPARIANGDEEAQLVMKAMTHGISKHICGPAAAVEGRLDAIVLAGGLAGAQWITDRIAARVARRGRCPGVQKGSGLPQTPHMGGGFGEGRIPVIVRLREACGSGTSGSPGSDLKA